MHLKIFQKYLILFIVFGLIWLDLEVFFRVLSLEMYRTGMLERLLCGAPALGNMSFFGFTSLWMFFIGGFTIFFLGLMNELNIIRLNLNVFWQSLAGAVIITLIEFTTGYIFNIKLGFNLWCYSYFPFNLLGQICLPASILWFFISPFAFWLDDVLRKVILGQGEFYSLWSVYKKLFCINAKPGFQKKLD
jgi:uncharacterized membrane protein